MIEKSDVSREIRGPRFTFPGFPTRDGLSRYTDYRRDVTLAQPSSLAEEPAGGRWGQSSAISSPRQHIVEFHCETKYGAFRRQRHAIVFLTLPLRFVASDPPLTYLSRHWYAGGP